LYCFQALVIFLSQFLPIRYHIETNGFLTCIVVKTALHIFLLLLYCVICE